LEIPDQSAYASVSVSLVHWRKPIEQFEEFNAHFFNSFKWPEPPLLACLSHRWNSIAEGVPP